MIMSDIQSRFKVWDKVIGYSYDYDIDKEYNGRVGTIIERQVDGIGHNLVEYSANDYWYYTDDELEYSKNHIVTSILNDL